MHSHRPDVLSFVAGLLAVGGAVLYQLDVREAIELDMRWLGSLGLIAAGLVGILTALRSRAD